MALLPKHLRLRAPNVERLQRHGIIALARRKPSDAEPCNVRGASRQKMRGRERDIVGQISETRPLLHGEFACQQYRLSPVRRLGDRLGKRRDAHGTHLVQTPVTPLVETCIGVSLLRVHQDERMNVRHGEGERERRQGRDADERDAQTVSDRLRRRQTDAKPRERAGADAHGDARERRALDARKGERPLNMRKKRLRMRAPRLDRHFRLQFPLARHGDARHRACRINRQNRQRPSSPQKIP